MSVQIYIPQSALVSYITINVNSYSPLFRIRHHRVGINYSAHKKFSTTRTCRVKFCSKLYIKFIKGLWECVRYEVKHPYLSSDVSTRVLKWRYGFVTYINIYIKCIFVSEIVIWLGSSRINSPKMENVENSFKVQVIRPLNLPFKKEEIRFDE